MKRTILTVGALLAVTSTSFGVETMAAFTEDFSAATDSHTVANFYYGSGGLKKDFTWKSGQTSSIEPESQVLKLTIDPADKPSAWQAANLTSNGYTHFGTYSARIKIPDVSSQPNVGAVVGFFTYYNDEWNTELPADINKNGLYDNSEIDFEWLVADPEIIYITAYTDYNGPTGETKKVARILNLAKGTIYTTNYAETLGESGTALTGVENQPETIVAIPGFNASKRFYTYGFDWHTDKIRWWIINPETNDTVVLWDYRGPQSRITQKQASIMLNFWHTNNWPVLTNAKSIETPKDTFSAEFDNVTFTPVGETSNFTVPQSRGSNAVTLQRSGSSTHIQMSHAGTYRAELYSVRGEKLNSVSFVGTETVLPSLAVPVILRIFESGRAVATQLVPRL